MNIPPFTDTLKRDLTIFVVIVAVIVASYRAGHQVGASHERIVAAKQVERVIRDSLAARAAIAATHERQTASLVHVADLAKANVPKAVAKTDTAHASADRAQANAVTALRDSLATMTQRQAAADSLVRADSLFAVRFQTERLANTKALALQGMALTEALATIDAKNVVIQLGEQDHQAMQKIITALQKDRPSVFGTAIRAVGSGLVGIAIYALMHR